MPSGIPEDVESVRALLTASRNLDSNTERALTLGGMLEKAEELNTANPEQMAEFARLCATSVVYLTRYVAKLRNAVEEAVG